MRIAHALIITLVLSINVEAKTLYVNASTGSDATSYAANGIGAPWASLCRATNGASSCASGSTNTGEAAQAGDTVIVAAGTYTAAGTGTRFLSPFNPANSGTAGNLIVFQCASAGACTLALSSSEGPTFGCRSRNYIRWDGFAVDGATSPSTSDTGHVDVFASTGCEILNSTIVGDVDHPNTGQGNYNAIRIEDTVDVVIRGNTLSNIAEENVYGGNQAAIMTYDVDDTVIEYNTISRAGNGIYFKGTHDVPGESQSNNIARYNLLYDMRFNCLDALSLQTGAFYQNICVAGTGGTNGQTFFGFADGVNIGVQLHDVDSYNNVFYGFTNCVVVEGASGTAHHVDLRFWNNICRTSTYGVTTGTLSGPGDIDFQHNVYSAMSTAVANFGSNESLATWQARPQDNVSPAAITSNPLFVSEATGASGDWHLQGGSPAINLGRTFGGSTVNAGAYITGSETIGAGGGGGSGATGTIRIRLRGQ